MVPLPILLYHMLRKELLIVSVNGLVIKSFFHTLMVACTLLVDGLLGLNKSCFDFLK